MVISVGIDEAGRGPVFGPMVMVALAVDEEAEQKLKWMGVKDSKLLSKELREELFERIREVVLDFRVQVVEPSAIDHAIDEDENLNLNWLEAEVSAQMLSELKPNKAYVDCPSTNPPAYKDYLLSRVSEGVKKSTEFIVEHKADMKYPVVAAASIVAKVIRDLQVEKIKEETGVDCGSGYMSDPKTQDFLKKYYQKHAKHFRKSWASYKKVQADADQRKLFEY